MSNKFSALILALEEESALLYRALMDSNTDGVLQLIEKNRSLLNHKFDGMPLIIGAYLTGNFELIKYLLAMSADVYAKDSSGENLIDKARRSSNKPLLSLLHKFGIIDQPEEEEETNQIIKDKFKFEGFTIVNAGLSEEKMREVLNALIIPIKKMKKFGFGNILYGPLVITSKELEGATYNKSLNQYVALKWAAYYNRAKDLIVMNSDNFLRDINYNLSIFAHELAHRHWYKVMSPTQRKIWAGDFEENRSFKIKDSQIDNIIQLMKQSAPEKTDRLGFKYNDWSEFNYSGFFAKLKRKNKDSRLLDIFDKAVKEWFKTEEPNKKRKEFINNMLDVDMFGGYWWIAKNMQAASAFLAGEITLDDIKGGLKREIAGSNDNGKAHYEWMKEHLGSLSIFSNLDMMVGKLLELPKSTTDYGSFNSEEDYAEAFSHFISNKPMPQEIFNLFARINNLRLASKNAMFKKNQ